MKQVREITHFHVNAFVLNTRLCHARTREDCRCKLSTRLKCSFLHDLAKNPFALRQFLTTFKAATRDRRGAQVDFDQDDDLADDFGLDQMDLDNEAGAKTIYKDQLVGPFGLPGNSR